jgi:DNA-binding response OmpR family regulator
MAATLRILVVSPFEGDRAALRDLLRADGHQVEVLARQAGTAIAAAAFRADVVVADAKLPGLDGLRLARALGALEPAPGLILLCARASCRLDGLGVPCLPKPIDLDLLRSHLAAPRAGRLAGVRREPSAA